MVTQTTAPTRTEVERHPTLWEPYPTGQLAFLTCPFPEVLGHGNRGGGKTETLIVDFLRDVGRGWGPDWRGVVFRKEATQLEDVIAKCHRLIEPIWPTARFNASKNVWQFPDGERLYLRHAKRRSDYGKHHGHQYGWIGWEELTEYAEPYLYLKMMSTLRSSHPEIAQIKRVRATCNPSGVGHNWVKSRFRLPGSASSILGQVIEDDRVDGVALPARVAIRIDRADNVALMQADPGYEATLRASSSSPQQLRAWVLGDWDIVSGGMFDDVWRADRNVVEPFEIPQGWRIDRSFDWGSSSPFAVLWWAESPGGSIRYGDREIHTIKGDLFAIAEWYGWNGRPNEGLRMMDEKIAQGIVEREMSMGIAGRVQAGPADPSIWARESGRCIADAMAAPVKVGGHSMPGVRWTRAKNERGANGWQPVRAAIANAYAATDKCSACGKDPTAASADVCHGCGAVLPVVPREKPGLYVFRTCEQFLRTIPVAPRDERDPDDLDTDSEDHIADALRYRVRNMPRFGAAARTAGRD